MAQVYHTSSPVKVCPGCGKEMEVGSRAGVNIRFEDGTYVTFKLVRSRVICSECGKKVAAIAGIDLEEAVL